MFGLKTAPSWGNFGRAAAGATNALAQNYGDSGLRDANAAAGSMFGNWMQNRPKFAAPRGPSMNNGLPQNMPGGFNPNVMPSNPMSNNPTTGVNTAPSSFPMVRNFNDLMSSRIGQMTGGRNSGVTGGLWNRYMSNLG